MTGVSVPLASAATGPALDSHRFWQVSRRFATGVSVVTTGAGDSVHGSTVTSFTFVSRQPALISVCLKQGSVLLDLVGRRGTFTVNVLGGAQAAVARHFADRRRLPGAAQFKDVDWKPGPDGVPLLADSVAWLRCRAWRRFRAGDHDLMLARVMDVAEAPGRPLLYFDGRLHAAAIEEAGP
ncbi:flavin reductase family protein [Streptomyces spectabilis]|uniref:Flavin reductase (DIM6/NTAB) family NADH-FMN oxidoreductase RutF n=1 Tax=Streptomyces spectabilis TaxID=68270 RepID=A0A7W8AM48_STRST|nr:flavin reductase family protein [Streptomyces spectabilis]MBB5100974.1 flavin reductase (DIM6/NTAB) family NADH-FMN oxidoreductase RutF [Streptomyces spectabilis]MCI3900187.1 flavin reductase family protein [Streptomyces spectabilis]GGV08788.1 flavin reductase [Streptomyces spectabilis]